jgi:hypothetical protein
MPKGVPLVWRMASRVWDAFSCASSPGRVPEFSMNVRIAAATAGFWTMAQPMCDPVWPANRTLTVSTWVTFTPWIHVLRMVHVDPCGSWVEHCYVLGKVKCYSTNRSQHGSLQNDRAQRYSDIMSVWYTP